MLALALDEVRSRGGTEIYRGWVEASPPELDDGEVVARLAL